MNFDEIIDRRGTDCAKWDKMEAIFGVSPDRRDCRCGSPTWISARRSSRWPAVARDGRSSASSATLRRLDAFRDATCWWMKTRHGWDPDPASISRDARAGQRHRALHRHVHRARRRSRADDTRLPRLSQGDPRFGPTLVRDAAGDRRGPLRARHRGMGRRDDRAGADDDPVLAAQSRRPGLDARGAAADRRFRAAATTCC